MATILEFRASQEPDQRSRGRRKRRSAEIVIFPGVRYERMPEAQDNATDARTSVVRDTLTLVE